MTKISKSVLERIEKEHIQPRSKWYFLLRNLLIGIFSVIFVLLGLIACTMIFQFLSHMMILEMLLEGPFIILKLLWIGIPVFWVAIWIILFAFGTVLAHESKHGYKIAWSYWVGLIFLIQIFGGFALYQSEIGERIDHFMGQFVRQYERAENRGARLWRNPDNGFLGGEILSVEDKTIQVKDRMEKQWTVDISESYPRGEVEIKEGAQVRMMGKKTAEDQFKAEMIGPVRRRGKGRGPQRRIGPPPTKEEREARREKREKEFKKLPPELQEKIQEKRKEAQEKYGANAFPRQRFRRD